MRTSYTASPIGSPSVFCRTSFQPATLNRRLTSLRLAFQHLHRYYLIAVHWSLSKGASSVTSARVELVDWSLMIMVEYAVDTVLPVQAFLSTLDKEQPWTRISKPNSCRT
jgi:hypothetical protein